MNIIHVCIVFLGVSFCLAFVGLSFGLFKQYSLRFFHLFLVLEALSLAFEWLLTHPGTPYKSAWFALMMASSFLTAPCIWLLAREIHENAAPRIWPPAWGQCAFVVVGWVLLVPLMLSSHGGNLLIDPTVGPTPLSGYIHEGMVAAVVLYLIQVPCYLYRCLGLFRERLRLDEFLFSNHDEPGLNTLRALTWVMSASWALSLSRTFRAMYLPWSPLWDMFFSLCEIGVMMAALYFILKRFWQYNADDQRMIEEVTSQLQGTATSTATEKYAKSALDKQARQNIVNKLVAQLIDNKIYRRNDLKLQHLCEAIGERPHYVSQVINQELGVTFFELVNQYRIEEAKINLLKHPGKAILDIALEVGFNSKSTFNKAFKASTGKTPSEYRLRSD